jgi:hypothetical protein
MKPATLALCLCLLLAGAAHAADEQLISTDHARTLSSARPWVAWTDDNQTTGLQSPRIWNGAGESPLARVPGPFSLGPNVHGRPTVTYERCRSSAPLCAIVQRNLASTTETVLVRDNARYDPVAGAGGAVAFTRNPRPGEMAAPGSGLYARRRGARHSARFSSDQPYSIDVGGGKLVYIAYRPAGPGSFDTIIRLLDLRTRRGPLIADVSDFAADCRCTDLVTYAGSPQIDGHYVYWLTSSYEHFATQPARIEIDRLDLRALQSPPLAYRPPRGIDTFAVSGGTVYYSAGFPSEPSGGVYRVTGADWQPTATRIPVR